MLYAFFWVIPRCLNFKCQHEFGCFCSARFFAWWWLWRYEYCLLGCDMVQSGRYIQIFVRNLLLPSSEHSIEGGSMLLWNITVFVRFEISIVVFHGFRSSGLCRWVNVSHCFAFLQNVRNTDPLSQCHISEGCNFSVSVTFVRLSRSAPHCDR
jgi:hypothetical protein